MLTGDISAAEPTLLDTGVVVSHMIGATASPEPLPHAKLVRQPAGYTTPAHFHEVDQFQVMVGGHGRLGAARMELGAFHYADRATPYGPIVSDDKDTLSYLTLRPRVATGVDASAQYMPGARKNRSRRPGRNLLGPGRDQQGAVAVWATLIEQPDGVCTRTLVVDSGRTAGAPEPVADSGPAFVIVLGGDVVMAGRPLVAPSVIWLEAEDSWPDLVAGQGGAWLLLTYFATSHGALPQLT
jgi:hypothetical protein